MDPINAYQSKGFLVLDEITPVIEALFGNYSLTPSENAGTAHIRYCCLIDQRSETETTWSDIFRNLLRVADGAGLELSPTTPRIEVLEALSTHFGGGASSFIPRDIEVWLRDGDARPDPEKLFALATILNDGHGLAAFMTEGAWRRNGDLGGQGVYFSHEFCVATSSLQALAFGRNVHGALLDGDIETTAFHFARAVDGLLSGIVSRAVRGAIRTRLATILSFQQPLQPDSRPIFGPWSIDFDTSARCERSTTL